MTAYYNEIDPKAAAWLRELIHAGLVAAGEVDERSIEDVRPAELAGFTQCHFFAGIGVWSYALRQAGWPDDRPVWTGSCPCQSFSGAGKGKGFADERHLWPAWFHLISQSRPATILGEQVESPLGIAWLDLVWSDLESLGYAFGSPVLPAAGFGAPHGRHRIFFVANAARGGFREFGDASLAGSSRHADGGIVAGSVGDTASDNGRRGECGEEEGVGPDRIRRWGPSSAGATSLVGNAEVEGLEGLAGAGNFGRESGRLIPQPSGSVARTSAVDAGSVADTEHDGHHGTGRDASKSRSDGPQGGLSIRSGSELRATNGFWANAEWLYCRDGKYRATKPGIAPLAHGVANRVVKLRGYGNAINAEVAKEFIKAYLEIEREGLI